MLVDLKPKKNDDPDAKPEYKTKNFNMGFQVEKSLTSRMTSLFRRKSNQQTPYVQMMMTDIRFSPDGDQIMALGAARGYQYRFARWDVKSGKQELRRAKDYVIGQIRLGLESTTQQVMWLGETVLAHGRLLAPEETIAEIEKVDVADVSEIACQVLKARNVSMSVIGPDLVDEDRDQLQEIVNALG